MGDTSRATVVAGVTHRYTVSFVPVDYPLAVGTLAAASAVLVIVLLAVAAALLAARRVSAISPVEALSEATVETSQPGKVRLGSGLATLVGAVSSSAVSVGRCGAWSTLNKPAYSASRLCSVDPSRWSR